MVLSTGRPPKYAEGTTQRTVRLRQSLDDSISAEAERRGLSFADVLHSRLGVAGVDAPAPAASPSSDAAKFRRELQHNGGFLIDGAGCRVKVYQGRLVCLTHSIPYPH